MSIWATFLAFEDATAPLGYYGSHVFPSPGAQEGHLDLALIPGFINPAGLDFDDEVPRPPHPFVRLSVNEATVVLPKDQALEMYQRLGEWLIQAGAFLPDVPEGSTEA